MFDIREKKKGGGDPPPPTMPASFPQTDLANAERFVETHAGRLRYCPTFVKWFAWDGIVWREEPRAGAQQEAAKAVARALGEEVKALFKKAAQAAGMAEAQPDKRAALEETSKKARKAASQAWGWVEYSQSVRGVRAMVALAESDPRITIRGEEWDFNPWILNVMNGSVDLRTGLLTPHNPENLCTKLAPVAFNPDAECPQWEAFLRFAMAGDEEMVAYLQKLVGYTLTGEVTEHVLAFHFGGGANGKSTFLNTISTMLGAPSPNAYAIAAPRDILMRRSGEAHPAEFAALQGVRFATCNEIGDGKRWDEGRVKDLCSKDPISCRGMRENWRSFVPSHKLQIAANNQPRVEGDDDGIWRRMKLIPWTVTVPEEARDKELPEKLREEIPGILAWAVRGCLAWQKEGLGTPKRVAEATAQYRRESDFTGQFLREQVEKDSTNAVPVKALREAYAAFCKETGAPMLGAARFNERLRGIGAVPGQAKQNGAKLKVWRGVRLLGN